MMKRYFVGLITFVCLFSLFFFLSCGDTEDTDSIVIPDELYDTSELTYDISDEEVQELRQLELPDNWFEEKDPELHAKYFHAQLLQQFGNIPAVHIVAEYKRKRLLTPEEFTTTLDVLINYAKAQYVLWPTASNRKYLEEFLKDQLMQETDDPELYGRIYREKLIKQFGDIPEVDIVVETEKKFKFGGFKFTGNEGQ